MGSTCRQQGYSLVRVLLPQGPRLARSGGGEAVDLACKLAAQYWREAGQCKNLFAARLHAFHGVGLLPFSLSGSYPRYKLINGYHKATRDHYVIRFPHPVTGFGTDNDLREARGVLEKYKDDIAAVIIEPVGGPPIGAYPDSKEYLVGLRKICDDLKILLIFDEILCGPGRCGALSVSEIFDVWPDIVILGKGITSGYQPVSVICLSSKVVDCLKAGSNQVMFGTTYGAHTTGCAAVKATLQYMVSNEVFKRVRRYQGHLHQALVDRLADLPFVADIRGLGYLWGVRFKDPRSQEAFPSQVEFHAVARDSIFQRGVIVYSKGQTIFGEEDFIIIAPQLDLAMVVIETGIDLVREGLESAYAKL